MFTVPRKYGEKIHNHCREVEELRGYFIERTNSSNLQKILIHLGTIAFPVLNNDTEHTPDFLDYTERRQNRSKKRQEHGKYPYAPVFTHAYQSVILQ
jgi:hypothetical protein